MSLVIDLLEIEDPSFIKKLSKKELKELAGQIREFLIDNISKTGGHLSSNLGIVEITIAMYYVFDPEKDKFLFDVGHQSYVHKILTGRAKDFSTLRQFGGLSGYISRQESEYDVWESGHSSTTISAMAGILISESQHRVVSLIGDSSIMNGVAFEGLNFLGNQNTLAPIIILNDNKMGISKSVGALSQAFSRLRGSKLWQNFKRVINIITPTFISNKFHQLKRGVKGFIQQDNIFEDLGYDYFGPIKGNDIYACVKALQRIKDAKEPVVLHILTKKGKGYAPSEADEFGNYHGIGPFDVSTGKPICKMPENYHSYSEIIAYYLFKKRQKQQFFVVTPAMKSGAKLDHFAKLYPKDFFDVGIAEEHAAVMSAGIALSGKRVVLLYYSTFAQRAYDEILNDICRQNLSVIIGIDRAGVVGEDGATHQGIYDVAMFSSMPNIQITMPRSPEEAIALFNYAFTHQGPIVVRYPRKSVEVTLFQLDFNLVSEPCWECVLEGVSICVISYGPQVDRLKQIIEKHDLNIGLINARFIRPIDEEMLLKLINKYTSFIVLEEIVAKGTVYHEILHFFNEKRINYPVKSISFDVNECLPHGKISEIQDHYGMSEEDILEAIYSFK